MVIDYRRKHDDVVRWNDFNHPEWFYTTTTNFMPSTIHWLDGTSHKIGDWEFDPVTGQVVDGKGNVVDYKAEKVTVGTKDDKTYQAPAQATNAKVEPKKQLPNTGTKETMLGLLGLGLLAGLGLGYTKKNLRK